LHQQIFDSKIPKSTTGAGVYPVKIESVNSLKPFQILGYCADLMVYADKRRTI